LKDKNTEVSYGCDAISEGGKNRGNQTGRTNWKGFSLQGEQGKNEGNREGETKGQNMRLVMGKGGKKKKKIRRHYKRAKGPGETEVREGPDKTQDKETVVEEKRRDFN